MAGPFEQLRVVEFGRFIAAPYCGQLLADGGADVIKVEPLEGDETRRNGPIIPGEGRQFLNKNRGKRSLAVDLADDEVRAAVAALVNRADIVVANFRPGQAERHGLDYESVAKTNPRVIYAENTAYGRQGLMADAPGMDVVLAAYAGLLNFQPEGPSSLADPIVDYMAGMLLAWGVSTALYTRERTGIGQRLDVALLQAALLLQNNHINHVDVIDGWREEFVDYLKTAFADGASWGDVLERREELQPHAVVRVYYGYLRTGDGTIAVAAMPRPLRLKMMEVVGFDDRWTREQGWLPADARAYAAELREAVEARLSADTTENWRRKLAAAGIPCAPLQFPEQLLSDPQVLANGFLTRLEHETVGGVTVVAPPVAFSQTPLRVRGASPVLGKDTRSVLAEAGLTESAIDSLVRRGVAVAAD